MTQNNLALELMNDSNQGFVVVYHASLENPFIGLFFISKAWSQTVNEQLSAYFSPFLQSVCSDFEMNDGVLQFASNNEKVATHPIFIPQHHSAAGTGFTSSVIHMKKAMETHGIPENKIATMIRTLHLLFSSEISSQLCFFLRLNDNEPIRIFMGYPPQDQKRESRIALIGGGMEPIGGIYCSALGREEKKTVHRKVAVIGGFSDFNEAIGVEMLKALERKTIDYGVFHPLKRNESTERGCIPSGVPVRKNKRLHYRK